MTQHTYLHLQASLERLKLTSVSDCLDTLAEEAAREHWTYVPTNCATRLEGVAVE
jgi:hypothetical protein